MACHNDVGGSHGINPLGDINMEFDMSISSSRYCPQCQGKHAEALIEINYQEHMYCPDCDHSWISACDYVDEGVILRESYGE